MKAKYLFILLLLSVLSFATNVMASPVDALLERIDRGASKKIKTELVKCETDFFEIDQQGGKPVVRANSYVNLAVGVNWYLKYHAGIHLSWNQMHAKLPAVMPKVVQRERHETDLKLRYDFNYCTFSYSMPFWDWNRWQEEIDWMALHGINMPLAAVGNECVWKRLLTRQGYSRKQIDEFIAGPAFLAWWEMNNLEGWGGPNPDSWYQRQEQLQKQILRRMKELGMSPVLPGYCGMVPSQSPALNKSASATDTGESDESSQSTIALWNGFTRPGILMPEDPRFASMARDYYRESKALYGDADFYSMDPFHEAKSLPEDLDFGKAGQAIMGAMKEADPDARWVVQGWTENPRPEMLAALPDGDIIILDLFSECRPMWGIPSIWQRKNGYENHDWMFCMLENFGGNIGLHGRMDQLLENFYMTKGNPLAAHLKGIGLTMEGLGTNPVMYELMCELPWRPEPITKEEWIRQYIRARYGLADDSPQLDDVEAAWALLVDGIYNCPRGNNQQGPHESVFCSRPSLECFQASSWSKMQNYYDPNTTMQAARHMLKVADTMRGNDNFEYDLVDICRQAIADRARIVYNRWVADFKSFDRKAFKANTDNFLSLLMLQDQLLDTRPEFKVGTWIKQARDAGKTASEKDHYEWNARVQITTWGNRYCADTGKLRDYAHKEWSGLLRDFYYKRWTAYIGILQQQLDGKLPVLPVGNSSTKTDGNPAVSIDFYAMEEPWTLDHTPYSYKAEGDAIDVAKKLLDL